MQELLRVAPDLDVGPFQPAPDSEQFPQLAAGREAGKVALAAERRESAFEQRSRQFPAETGLGGGAQEQPRLPVRADHRRQMAQTAEIDVAGGDREAIVGSLVLGEVGEAFAVLCPPRAVIEKGWTFRHSGNPVDVPLQCSDRLRRVPGSGQAASPGRRVQLRLP